LSQEVGTEPVSIDEESLAPWEPGGSEYVVRLLGEIDDRWVERFVLTRKRSARFSRFHLNRAKGRVSFVCRSNDDDAGPAVALANLKLLIEQTNHRFALDAAAAAGTPLRSQRESEDDTLVAPVRRAEAPVSHAAPEDAPAATAAAPESPGVPETPAEVLPPETAETPAPEAAAELVSPSRLIEAIQLSMRLLAGVPTERERMSRLAEWMGTATLVIEDGGPEAEALASLISTSAGPEITDAAQEEIRDRFGDRVANLVRGCHEGEEALKPGGDPRLYSLYLRHTTASIRRILCASLLRGARALLATYQRLDVGRRLGFRDENQAGLVYYRSIVEAVLEAGYSSHLVDDLDGVVLEMELAAGPASAERRQKRPLDRLTDELVERVELLEPEIGPKV